jgi:hypothetical protein
MTGREALARGRAAFERKTWGDAYRELSVAGQEIPLEPEDLDRLATAAYLVGEESVSAETRARAHAGFLERGDLIRAARSGSRRRTSSSPWRTISALAYLPLRPS